MHKYGFDAYKDKLPPGTYTTISAGGKTLHLPWKSVATGGSDRLLVTPPTDSTLTFSYQGGMPLSGNRTPDGYHVWSANPPGGEDNLLALCNADSAGNASVAGGVRVKAYDLKRHRVTVVPVGSSKPSFTKAELQATLNSIYAQAVTEWEVTFEEPIDANGIAENPEINETDYSNDMRAIWRAYVGQRTNVPGTTYLFIIPGFTGNTSMVGYMPLKSGYGFLTPKATTRDAAHELGHGVFNLRHIFSSGNVVNLPEGSTKNLMDYSTGSELFKYQWDYIHNPEGGRFLFVGSEEGAFSLPCVGWFDDCKDVLQILETFRSARLNGNQVKIKGQEKLEERVLVANSVKVGVNDYKKIRLIYKPKPEDYSINPVNYESYNQQFFVADGSVDWQRGFIYYNDGEELFKILVDDEVSKIDSLKEYLIGVESLVDPDADKKIVIKINRIRNNSHRSVGEINIDNGAIVGYTLELPKGTDSECQSTCTKDKKANNECSRIIKGIYTFEITSWSEKEHYINKSLRIHNVPGRTGILIHRGVNARIWSYGCLLAMRNNPSNDKDDAAANQRANNVSDSEDFCVEIVNYVNQRVDYIKKEYKFEKIELKVIITEDNEIND